MHLSTKAVHSCPAIAVVCASGAQSGETFWYVGKMSIDRHDRLEHPSRTDDVTQTVVDIGKYVPLAQVVLIETL
jgi:hypothetical protein